MKACILIKTELGKHNEVAKAIAGMDGVKLAFPVLGRTDVAVNVEIDGDLKALSAFLLKVREVGGIASSETIIAKEV